MTLMIGLIFVNNCLHRHFTYARIYQYLIALNVALTPVFHCISARSALQQNFYINMSVKYNSTHVNGFTFCLYIHFTDYNMNRV